MRVVDARQYRGGVRWELPMNAATVVVYSGSRSACRCIHTRSDQ